MTWMSWPSCESAVLFKRGESTSRPAVSSGTMSVRLRPGVAPTPLGIEARVRELLRKRGLSRANTA
jgi:hypothetical protein